MINQIIYEEQLLNASLSDVWKAITDKNEMKLWYFELDEFIPEVGFKFQFWGGPSPDNQYLHLCEVIEVITKQKLVYSWQYDGYYGNTTVCFELLEKGSKTLLKFKHEGFESFPYDNPDFEFSNFKVGWNHIIHTSLKGYFEK